MKHLLRLALLFKLGLLTACVSEPHLTRDPAQVPQTKINTYAEEIKVPNSEAFRGWINHPKYQLSSENIDQLEKIAITCSVQILYPTHPTMDLKEYHVYLSGRYDHFKLAGNFDNAREVGKDEACFLSAPRHSKRGTDGRLNCLDAHTIEFVILSDTYQDQCGNYYRGYSKQLIFPRDHRMQDLWSPGRWTYLDPNSEFNREGSSVKDVLPGHTYEVQATDFIFLTPLFPTDAKKVGSARANALKYTHTYNPKTFLFNAKEADKSQ